MAGVFGRRSRAVRVIQRKWRGRRMKRTPVVRGMTKAKTKTISSNSTVLSKTLYFHDLTNILFGTATSERERNTLLLSGIQLRYSLDNSVTENLVIRMALIRNKTENILTSDFFTGYDNERGLDFSAARNGLQMSYNPINPNKFVVLKSWRFPLAGHNGTATGYNQGSNMSSKSRRQWLPIKKRIVFDNNGSTASYQPIYFVWWMDWPTSAAGAGVVALNTARVETIVYFHDSL